MVAQIEKEKELAARAAIRRVRPGSLLALGTGTTTAYAVRALAEADGKERGIVAVASSRATEELARRLGITIRPLQEGDQFDLMVDGADEVAPDLSLTKGGGGALLREKLLARLSRERLIVVDHTKLVNHLGERAPIPVEVVPFARPIVVREVERLGFRVSTRKGPDTAESFRTDNGNEILDLWPSKPIDDPARTETELRSLTGVVECGIFVGLADRVYVGRPNGKVEELSPP